MEWSVDNVILKWKLLITRLNSPYLISPYHIIFMMKYPIRFFKPVFLRNLPTIHYSVPRWILTVQAACNFFFLKKFKVIKWPKYQFSLINSPHLDLWNSYFHRHSMWLPVESHRRWRAKYGQMWTLLMLSILWFHRSHHPTKCDFIFRTFHIPCDDLCTPSINSLNEFSGSAFNYTKMKS